MRKYFRQFAAALLSVALMTAPCQAAAVNDSGEMMIRIGLASSSDHNALKELACAQLQNSSGYGAGYQFGYYDDNLNFCLLGYTNSNVTKLAVMKTQNLYYGYSSSQGRYTYTDEVTSEIGIGCYHVRIPGTYPTYEDAAMVAQEFEDGFVAWINGEYQVRVGAYIERTGAENTLASLGAGEIVATSAYGINVVETGTDRVLFQFDNGQGSKLAVLPDVTQAQDVYTWFRGFKYRGGFTYERIGGGNLTVVNVVTMEDYIKGVAPYEMGRNWPLEALKTQATCARTYAMGRLNYHDARGFDLCNSDNCQVYYGVGSDREDYGPSSVSDQAVEETAKQVVWYGDKLAETYYSSSHGGASENIELVWGSKLSKYPYLCGVSDPYEETIADVNPYANWKVSYSASELTKRLQSKGYGVGTKVDHLNLTYSELGNVVKVEVHWTNGQKNSFTPSNIRTIFGVKSIRFTINDAQAVYEETDRQDDKVPVGNVIINETQTAPSLEGMYVLSANGIPQMISSGIPYVVTGTGTVQKWTQPEEEEKKPSEEVKVPTSAVVKVSGDSYVFNGSGWGHQLGMSQYGANAMARLGFTYEEIIQFYFPGTYVDSY